MCTRASTLARARRDGELGGREGSWARRDRLCVYDRTRGVRAHIARAREGHERTTHSRGRGRMRGRMRLLGGVRSRPPTQARVPAGVYSHPCRRPIKHGYTRPHLACVVLLPRAPRPADYFPRSNTVRFSLSATRTTRILSRYATFHAPSRSEGEDPSRTSSRGYPRAHKNEPESASPLGIRSARNADGRRAHRV